jgi:hypothetical protein
MKHTQSLTNILENSNEVVNINISNYNAGNIYEYLSKLSERFKIESKSQTCCASYKN